jgi:hypothetical protein
MSHEEICFGRTFCLIGRYGGGVGGRPGVVEGGFSPPLVWWLVCKDPRGPSGGLLYSEYLPYLSAFS